MPSKMPQDFVLQIYQELEARGVPVWIDGGWGVDALLGYQSREHGDLDIALEAKHEPQMRSLLQSQGFRPVPRDDTRPWNYVLGDDEGHLIDVHVIVLDQNGDGIYGPQENGEKYPASALLGRGRIGNHPVRCISAEDQVRFHTGYDPDQEDYQDVLALCAAFQIELPEPFRSWNARDATGLAFDRT